MSEHVLNSRLHILRLISQQLRAPYGPYIEEGGVEYNAPGHGHGTLTLYGIENKTAMVTPQK